MSLQNLKIKNYLFLFLFLVLEVLILISTAKRTLIEYYPGYYDQAAYLYNTYKFYYFSVEKNLFKSSIYSLWSPSSTGVLTYANNLLFIYLFGVGRLSALYINFLYLVSAQFFIYYSISKYTKSNLAGLFALGLFSTVNFPFFFAGGVFDLRFDFGTTCLYSILLSLIICSDLFLKRKYIIPIALVGSFCILNRFIAVIYVFGLYISYIFYLYYFSINKLSIKNKLQELKNFNNKIRNIIIVIAITTFVTFPFLIHNFNKIYSYYFLGHFLSEEKNIRAAEQNVHNFWDSISYYPISVFRDHLGHYFFYAFIIYILIIFFYNSFLYFKNNTINSKNQKKSKDIFILLAISIFIPIFLLTLDVSKSPVVGQIVVPSIIFFFTIFTSKNFFLDNTNKFIKNFTYLFFIFCSCILISFETKPAFKETSFQQAKSINELYSKIYFIIKKNYYSKPIISFIDQQDFFDYAPLAIWAVENKNEWLDLATVSSGGILEKSKNELIQLIKSSNIVLIPKTSISGIYPVYTSYKKYKLDMYNYLNKNFTYDGNFILFDGYKVDIYSKPNILITGLTKDSWVTHDGILITIPNQSKKNSLNLSLKFKYTQEININNLDVNLVCKYLKACKFSKEIYLENNNNFIFVNIKIPEQFSKDELKFNLKFNQFFIPNLVNKSNDQRKLSLIFDSFEITQN